jgi:hypothetical protein
MAVKVDAVAMAFMRRVDRSGNGPVPLRSSRTIRSSPVSSQYTNDTGIMPTVFTSSKKRFMVNASPS